METCSMNSLNDDCLERIFRKLSSYDLASISLACKRFLFITNQAKVALVVSDFTVQILPSLLRRFRNLKSIEFRLRSHNDPNQVITQISQSGLQHLEALISRKRSVPSRKEKCPGKGFRKLGVKMKGLKKLDLSGLCYMCDKTLIVLKDFFPCLEELNINGRSDKMRYLPVTDDGIEALSSKLKRLKKIILPCLAYVTDKSLMSLSSNCVDLMDVRIIAGPLMTEYGIGFLMRHSPRLTSLYLTIRGSSFWKMDGEFTFENSISYASNLEHLKFDSLTNSEGVLYAIAKASLPLKTFRYRINHGIKYINGLPMLLRSCPSLKQLTLKSQDPRKVCSTSLHIMINPLSDLTHIDLSNVVGLNCGIILMLTKNLPFLEQIDMCSAVGPHEDFARHLHRNYRMKHLSLCRSCHLNDQTLVRFGLICPNLEFFDISEGKGGITDLGIAEFLNVCPKLKHLDVSELSVSNFVKPNKVKKLKLASIFAHDTYINNEALHVVGTMCPDLEKLCIQNCRNVTNIGVKMLMSKSEKLREINMIGCRNLTIDLWGWIMNLRPLLKVGVDFIPLEAQRNLFFGKSSIVLRGYYSNDKSDENSNDSSDDEHWLLNYAAGFFH